MATIEIPFGAKDSELMGWEYTIPEDMEAAIKDGKVIVKKKENEDERIRNRIISYLKQDIEEYPARKERIEEMLTYLEKQKEQKLTAEEVLIKAGLKPYRDGNQWCILAGDNIQEGICGFGDTIDDALYDFLMAVLNMQKEQKPAEWSDSFKENIRSLLHDKLTWHSEGGNMSSTVFIDDKTLKDIISGIWFYVGKEALKYPNTEVNVTEWSEEDEKIVRFYEDDYNHKIGNIPMKDVIENRLKFKEWLKNRLKSIRPQPKQEWSEEEIVNWAYDNFRISSFDMTKIVTNFSSMDELERSLREKLKSIHPQSHWKPSEEQVSALERAIVKAHTRDDIATLTKLRDNLKNLIK